MNWVALLDAMVPLVIGLIVVKTAWTYLQEQKNKEAESEGPLTDKRKRS